MSNPAHQIRPEALPTVRERIDANRAAMAQAEHAGVHTAIDGQRWERRGVLRRLRRLPALRGI
jgi:hypothetical protein